MATLFASQLKAEIEADLIGYAGGPVPTTFIPLRAFSRLYVTGTGTVTLETRAYDGTVLKTLGPFSPSTSPQFPDFDENDYQVRVSAGTATAEIV